MKTITANDLVDEVLRLAKENPDAVYTRPPDSAVSCYYTKGEAAGKTGCIFGQALTNLGADMSLVADMEAPGVSTGIMNLMRNLGIEGSPYLKGKLSLVQSLQDRGFNWARAAEEVETVVRDL